MLSNKIKPFCLERAGGLHVIILREEKGPRGPKYNAHSTNRTLDHNIDPTHNKVIFNFTIRSSCAIERYS
jgi:hypothetical protein